MSSEVNEFQELLERIVNTSGAIPFSQLYAFSDLSRDRLASFYQAWETLEATERRRLMHALVELAEAAFQVNFDAIFRHAMSDPDPEVRAAAIDGLWENEEASLIGPLITALRSDPVPEVRAAAATGLGRFVLAGELEQIEQAIANRIMTELLTAIHLGGESVEVRRRALESAGYACTPEVSEALDSAYTQQDERLRLSALVGMGRSCDRRWQEIVLAELSSPSAAMRYEAAVAAGEMSLGRAVPLLAQRLEDRDRQVRDATIWALGQIGGAESKRLLLNALREADEETQAIVEEALGEHALADGELEFTLYELEDLPEEQDPWEEESDLDDLGLASPDGEDWDVD